MTVVLHLGVVDVPYTARKSSLTTVDVAKILEAKYHIYQNFFDSHRDEIVGDITASLQDAADDVLRGAPPRADPFASAGDDIRKRFDDFITLQQIEAIGIPGVPTQAAKDGKSARRKKARKKGKRRPSFFDTGTYLGAFRAWAEYV